MLQSNQRAKLQLTKRCRPAQVARVLDGKKGFIAKNVLPVDGGGGWWTIISPHQLNKLGKGSAWCHQILDTFSTVNSTQCVKI